MQEKHMKKEVLFAIILGVIVGSIVMYGIYTARNAMTASQQKRIEATPNTTLAVPEKAQGSSGNLQISSPLDGTLTDQSTIQFTGKTFPGSIVVVLNNGVETVIDADLSGNFSTELSLTAGSNYIETTAITQDGKQEFDQRTIVFSTANLDETPETASASGTPKPSSTPKPSATPKTTTKSSPAPTPKTGTP